MGKPKKIIDIDQVEKLAHMHCTQDEIAAWFGMTRQNWHARYANQQNIIDAMERGRAKGKISLRRSQWIKAVEQNNTIMMIWLGKQLLGQKDVVLQQIDDSPTGQQDENAAKQRLFDKIATVVNARRPTQGDKSDQ